MSSCPRGTVAGAMRSAPSWYDGPDERALRDEAARRARVRQEAREIEDEESEKDKKGTPAQRIRRFWAKRKADRLFGKPGSSDGSAASGEGGPRAAVYKGEMGSSQRRASRMQDEEGGSRERGASARRGRKLVIGPKLRIFAASVACLALVCVFLYQPARQYYQSVREHDALAAEYAALQEREDALQSSVDALSTEEGMEDLAHEQYGLVKKGEVSVSVSGVEDSASADDSIPPNVSAGSVEPPDTWYSGILDPLFGVQ